MNPDQWFIGFRAMHELAKGGKLSDSQQKDYLEAREQLARSLLAAQGLTGEPGKPARQSFRVAQGLQIDLNFALSQTRAMTLDLSTGGFSVMLHRAPDEKEQPGYSLRLPGGVDPIIGRARVVSVIKRVGNVRASFSFIDMSATEQARLETVLFDLVLLRFK